MKKIENPSNDFDNPNPMAIAMTQTFMSMNKPIKDWFEFANTFAFTYCFFSSAVGEFIDNPKQLDKLLHDVIDKAKKH